MFTVCVQTPFEYEVTKLTLNIRQRFILEPHKCVRNDRISSLFLDPLMSVYNGVCLSFLLAYSEKHLPHKIM